MSLGVAAKLRPRLMTDRSKESMAAVSPEIGTVSVPEARRPTRIGAVRTLFLGMTLLLLGIPALLVANAHRPEYNCGASTAACEHGEALTPVPGRFSESTYQLVHALGYGLLALGVGLMLVGGLLLRGTADGTT